MLTKAKATGGRGAARVAEEPMVGYVQQLSIIRYLLEPPQTQWALDNHLAIVEVSRVYTTYATRRQEAY